MPEKIECLVRFVTPAFLGNAEQKGQWRTPPFKALLRQWWRVTAAREYAYDHTRLREAEGMLFGHAWLTYRENNRDKTWAMQGKVRLRLDKWRDGQMRRWPDGDRRERHPEAGNNGMRIDTHLYLGYGPLQNDRERHKTKLEKPPAIDANDAAALRLGMSSQHQPIMTQTLNLIHWFGTIGGRSRNGWGSVNLEGIVNYTPPIMDDLLSGAVLTKLAGITRPLTDCLRKDWPHALGTDGQGPLLWKSRRGHDNWSQAMQELARVKIAFRTACSIERNQDKEENGRCNPCFDDRHLLAYPVTHHGVDGWVEKDDRNRFKRDRRGEYLIQSGRLANQLRFKVVKDSSNRYWCLTYHLPCGLPETLQQKLGSNRIGHERQLCIWQQVHGILNNEMQRIGQAQGGRP